VCFAHLPAELGLPGRWLVLAHREELLDQAAAKFRAAAPELSVGVEQADRRAGDARVVIASVATLQRSRLVALDPDDFAGVIVDEAHHAVAPSYLAIFDHLGLLEEGCPRPLVGFTATPKRGDEVGLSEVFEAIAYEAGLREMIEAGYLAPLAGLRIGTECDLSGVHLRAGDFVAAELEAAVDTDARNALVVRAFREHAPSRRALAFCVGVAHAERLAETFRTAGIPAATVHGETAKDERRAILARFAAGELRVVSNCGVLTEGFDDPGVDAILMARPTKSSLLYTQIIGRGTRPAEGKPDCLVIDFVDNSTRHTVNTVASLFGLPPDLDLAGRSAVAVKEQLELTEERYPWIDTSRLRHVDDLRVVASRIEFFNSSAPAELERFTTLHWMRLADGGYRLALPERERLEVVPTLLDTWRVRFVDADRQERTLYERPTLIEAIRAADEGVRRHRADATKLLDLRARWRRAPATEKQIALLDKLGLEFPPELTKGQAAAMLTLAFEQRKGRGRYVDRYADRRARG